MDKNDKKAGIKQRMEEAESQFKDRQRFYDHLQDVVNQSRFRLNSAISDKSLTPEQVKNLMRLESDGQKSFNALSEQMEEIRQEHLKEMAKYNEELSLAEEEFEEREDQEGENPYGTQ